MGFDPTNFNPQDHGDAGGEMCPPGTYICFCTSGKRVKDRGKPQIDFIVQPVINAETGKVLGENTSGLFETATLTEKAVWRFANMCEAIQSGPFNANSDSDVQAKILGKPFKATIAKDVYNGLEKRKITGYKKLNSSDEKKWDSWKEEASLNTSMDGGDTASNGGGSQSSGGSSDDDDIPF